MSADLLARLITAGTPAELVAEVALELARAEAESDALAARRTAERERSKRYRDRGGDQIPGWLRRQVFERDGYACCDCAAEEDLQCDHIIPLMVGGETTLENLQTLCKPCNARKRDRVRKAEKRGLNRTKSDRAGEGGPGRTGPESPHPPSDKETSPIPPKEINSPTPSNEASASSLPPAGADAKRAGSKVKRERKSRPRVGSRLSADWQAPAIDELPLEVQAIVRQWPAGAYELTAISFRNHWLAEGRGIGAKRDWPRTWHNWLIRESADVLRRARAGVRFDQTAPRKPKTAAAKAEDARLEAMVAALRPLEGEVGQAIHALLAKACDRRGYECWLKPCAIVVDGADVTLIAPTDFMAGQAEGMFGEAVADAAATAIGRRARIFYRTPSTARLGPLEATGPPGNGQAGFKRDGN